MSNGEKNVVPARPNRYAWIYPLVSVTLGCALCVGLWIYVRSAPPRVEEPLSDVKTWGIEQVEKMPYVQGEHKQEILKQINEANDKGEVQGVVYQAEKDNDEIRVLVAAHRLESHNCDNDENK